MEVGVAVGLAVELGSLHIAVQIVLPGEADAAVDLEARTHDPLGCVVAPDLGRRRPGRRIVVGLVRQAPRAEPDHRPHALDVDEHVGAAVLHGLEAPDGLAELDALLGVVHRGVHGPLGAAEHLGRRREGAAVEQRTGQVLPTDANGGRALEGEPRQAAGLVHGRLGHRPTGDREVDEEHVGAGAHHGDIGQAGGVDRIRASREKPLVTRPS